jgi:hypothetical protein
MHVRPNQPVLEAALGLYRKTRESGMYRGGRRGAFFSALRALEISTNDTQGRYKEARGPWWIYYLGHPGYHLRSMSFSRDVRMSLGRFPLGRVDEAISTG